MDSNKNGQLTNTLRIVDGDAINLTALIALLLSRKRLILVVTLCGLLASVTFSLVTKKIYKAQALISATNERTMDLPSQMLGLSSALGLFSQGMGSNVSRILGILKSRTLLDAVIAEHHLDTLFQEDNRDDLREKVLNKFEIDETKDGMIQIAFEYHDPIKARDIVNTVIQHLDHLNIELNAKSVSSERKFLENRLAEVSADLKAAEENLLSFQKENHLFEPATQTSFSSSTLMILHQQIIETETQLGVMSSIMAANSPTIQELRSRLNELRKQVAKVSGGNPAGASKHAGGASDFMLPLGTVPEVGVQYLRFKRELKIQETLFELLTSQYELSKIGEQRTTPTIMIIDEAVTPERKVWPKRTLIVLVSTFLSFLMAILYVLLHASLSTAILPPRSLAG
ncbi:MAG: hypothetical protein A2284_17945 [Deltaproteobacteria bacterium RIFOXYA12_FULL_61_11]|nr:MAG: hypothetical protein A2284_17945 [Deltaproteobacteria bacterium RIFOXYA12_FULL_61_11]